MEEDVLTDMNKQFSLDSLDRWTTISGLIASVVSFIEKNMPRYCVHVFYHAEELHEYREIDREGLASIPDDSLFIGCLSMVSETIPVDKMFIDYQIDDPIIAHMLQTVYNGRYIVPVVHGFELLAFIIVCIRDPEDTGGLPAESIGLLDSLAGRLQVNMFAASVADRRQRELLLMANYPCALQQHKTLDEVYSSLLDDLRKQIAFDRGVCYAYEPAVDMLMPFDRFGIKGQPERLQNGRGISGQSFAEGKPLFVPDRNTHPSYALMKEEPFIDGSFVSVPFGTTKVKLGVITLVRNPGSRDPFSIEHRYMLEIAAAFIANEITNRQLFAKLDASNFTVVESLARALEAKDEYTEGHSARVTKYAEKIGAVLGYTPERMRLLKYGAMLHDIGKIGISDAIIHKNTKLTDEEFKKIKEHTEIGYNIVNNNPFFDTIKYYIRYHHEMMNGGGYYGKKAGEYPEEAMVISCADIFDALTSNRPYRSAMQPEDALAEMEKQIDIHYSKTVFDALVSSIRTGGSLA